MDEAKIDQLEENAIQDTMIEDEETPIEHKIEGEEHHIERAGIDIKTPEFLLKAFNQTRKFLSDFTQVSDNEESLTMTDSTEIDPENPIAINLPTNLTSPQTMESQEEPEINDFQSVLNVDSTLRIADQQVLQFVKTIYGLHFFQTLALLLLILICEMSAYTESLLTFSAISLLITHAIFKYRKTLRNGSVFLIQGAYIFDFAVTCLLLNSTKDSLWFRAYVYLTLAYSLVSWLSCRPFAQPHLPTVISGQKTAKVSIAIAGFMMLIWYPIEFYFSYHASSFFSKLIVFLVLIPVFGFGSSLQLRVIKERLFQNMDKITWKDCVILALTLRYRAFWKLVEGLMK